MFEPFQRKVIYQRAESNKGMVVIRIRAVKSDIQLFYASCAFKRKSI